MGKHDPVTARQFEWRRGIGCGPDHRSRAGYTLTELLVVLLILGLLAAAITPVTIDQMNRAKARTAKLQMESIAAAISLYAADVGSPPSAEQGLAALLKAPSGAANWSGPYIRSPDRLIDPWQRPYVVVPASETAPLQVRSLGADGKPGGEGANADITVS